jgi:hypothetical protein
MKNSFQILFLVLLLSLPGHTNAQGTKDKVDLVAGASIPELYHIGVRFHYIPKARIDLNLGSDFNIGENGRLDAVTLNHGYYFGKTNQKVNHKTWSINTGFSLLMEKKTDGEPMFMYFNLFLSKEFPITSKLFIQPELGASYFLFEHSSNPDYYSLDYHMRLIPKFGLNLFFRI